MACDFGVVEFGWRVGGGYNMIRNFMRGLGQESSNLLPAFVKLSIRLAFVVRILVIFKVRAWFRALRW